MKKENELWDDDTFRQLIRETSLEKPSAHLKNAVMQALEAEVAKQKKPETTLLPKWFWWLMAACTTIAAGGMFRWVMVNGITGDGLLNNVVSWPEWQWPQWGFSEHLGYALLVLCFFLLVQIVQSSTRGSGHTYTSH